MTRSLPEWIGATPDTAIPPRVRLRVFEAKDGRCGQCTRKITAGEPWTLEHIKALVNGGENREANLGVTCSNCLAGKNAADVAEKATVYRKKAKHLGIKAKYSRPLPGSKASGWKRKMSGEVVRREK
jgi:5-methylcytosine-specific restriction protein A